MLTVQDISFRHPRGTEDILREIAFSLPAGLMTTILGPNGSGKTTLFRCIAGLWQPRCGAIRFGDQNLLDISPERLARILAVVPQEHQPPFPYTVEDIVLMGRVSHISLFSTPSQDDRRAAEEAMAQLGIGPLKGRPYTKISGGERQMVLIARALAQETPLLLLDEPTSHLDFRNQLLILSQVRNVVRQKGLTTLMTLHDPNLAMQFSDRILLIDAGRVIAEGPPDQVLSEENLRRIYDIDVSVIPWNGTHIIHPQAPS